MVAIPTLCPMPVLQTKCHICDKRGHCGGTLIAQTKCRLTVAPPLCEGPLCRCKAFPSLLWSGYCSGQNSRCSPSASEESGFVMRLSEAVAAAVDSISTSWPPSAPECPQILWPSFMKVQIQFQPVNGQAKKWCTPALSEATFQKLAAGGILSPL